METATAPPTVPVLVVVGPTASGKSRLAMAVAEACRGTAINADSMQVYRELRILTARPAAADEARVPHRLFGVLGAAERCSAGRWLGMATAAIAEARDAGRLPIAVGGTGLYLKALLEGLAPVPDVPEEAREAAKRLWRAEGEAGLRARLARLDAEAAARIAPGDRQRLLRAHAVAAATGRPLTDWQRDAARSPLAGRRTVVALLPPRDALYAAIERRFDRMMAEGALAEVRALVACGLDPALPAMKAVGVRELIAHLEGRIGLEEAVALAKRRSRQYAKRQITWIRHQVRPDLLLDAKFSESMAEKIFPFIRQIC